MNAVAFATMAKNHDHSFNVNFIKISAIKFQASIIFLFMHFPRRQFSLWLNYSYWIFYNSTQKVCHIVQESKSQAFKWENVTIFFLVGLCHLLIVSNNHESLEKSSWQLSVEGKCDLKLLMVRMQSQPWHTDFMD